MRRRCESHGFTVVLFLAGACSLNETRAENIDPAASDSQYAYAENAGWINAEPSGDGGPGMQVEDFDLTGWMWAENIGWISLSCKNTSDCGTVEYGVRNTCAGALSGFAWGENAGWINFNPAPSGVTIDPITGNLSGYAWGENVGWISFSCDNTSSCGAVDYRVRTSWTASEVVPTGSTTLMLERSGSETRLQWSSQPGAAAYDVVRGDLTLLSTSGGNFALATEECVADDSILTSQRLSDVPAVGQGFWFVVRGVNCAGSGSYDTGEPSQVGLRDAEIAAAGNDCP